MAQHTAQQNAEGSRDLSTLVDASAELQHLVQTIWRLRQLDGCPWDREQTHQSIGKNMIEEAYEALDCIEADDVAHLREELGDVLMQVVLHAQIAADAGEFTLADVARDIDAKLIRRHPHVFGDADADNSDEVLKIWDEVKLAEKAAKDKAVAAGEAAPESLLDGVPTHLPALMQAQKVSRKAAAVGFEWETVQDVWDEVAEERAEFEAEAPGSPEREMEFGDLLFALVNVARKGASTPRAPCARARPSPAVAGLRWSRWRPTPMWIWLSFRPTVSMTCGMPPRLRSKTAGTTSRHASSLPLNFSKNKCIPRLT